MKVKVWLLLLIVGINIYLMFFYWNVAKWWILISAVLTEFLFVYQNSGILDFKNAIFGSIMCMTCGWFGLPYYAIYYFLGGKDE